MCSSRFAPSPWALLILCALLCLVPTASAQTTYTVTKTADTDDGTCDADCSLREALAAADASAGGDVVRFDASLAGQTVTLALGQLTIAGEVTVDGGAGVAVSGGGASRVLLIQAGAEVELIGLTVRDGYVTGFPGGAGIRNNGTLTLTDCTVRSNEAERFDASYGGGITNTGTLTVTGSVVRDNVAGFGGGGLYNNIGAGPTTLINSSLRDNESFLDGGGALINGAGLLLIGSTVSGNVADNGGGGIANNSDFTTLTNSTVSGNTATFWQGGGINNSGGELTVTNSTITDNTAGDAGGGVAGAVRLTISNSILAGNSGSGTSDDCGSSTIVSEGYNVTGGGTGCANLNGPGDTTVDPADVFSLVLDPALADNGGPTLTHALQGGAQNPAVDIGGSCAPEDQRGFPAPVDGDGDGVPRCDAGSVERGAAAIAAVTLTLVPDVPPVVIPAEGGPVFFNVVLENTTGEAQTVQAWSEATLPGGSVRGPLLGPVTVRLAPGQQVQRALVQTVPGHAPAGTYTYTGLVGDFPDAPIDSDSFGAAKLAERRGTAGAAEGAAAWTVVDAATGEALTAGTRWSSDDLLEAAASSASVPETFALGAVYPNPFHDTATLTVEVPTATEVRVVVYDVLGRAVATLLDGKVEAGRHEVALDASGWPSGVYLVRMAADGFAAGQRVTLVR